MKKVLSAPRKNGFLELCDATQAKVNYGNIGIVQCNTNRGDLWQ